MRHKPSLREGPLALQDLFLTILRLIAQQIQNSPCGLRQLDLQPFRFAENRGPKKSPITGFTGSGKSTTLAAMMDHTNKNRRSHIITVEVVHKSQSCHVSHREVGAHMLSFATALRAALRENPDIILVSEMKDSSRPLHLPQVPGANAPYRSHRGPGCHKKDP